MDGRNALLCALLMYCVGLASSICTLQSPTTPHKLSICTMVNNEAAFLEEWLSYHLLINVDHFYIYDDESTDNTLQVLEPYIKQGFVTVIPWHKEKKTVDPSLVSVEPPYTLSQRFAIADCLFNHQHESEWFGVIDVDEFMVLNSHPNMHAFIKFVQDTSDDYRIPMAIFGYAGYVSTPPGLVMDNYQWRSNVTVFGMNPYTNKFSGKSMYKSGCGLPNIHFTTELPPGCRKHHGWVVLEGDSQELPLTINHYALKSWDHFTEKMQKWKFGVSQEDFDSQIEYSNNFHDDSLVKFSSQVEEIIQCMSQN
eukprot:Phypoly_transcript_12137.p1 GENE.Phypoly_transcript_12137~~Phypoly_transcript_12137.p1  ORF type:complete len:309 (+),score=40.30 Phypoly_transcript_12137:214-1140(+)